MWHRVDMVLTDVSEERIASIFCQGLFPTSQWVPPSVGFALNLLDVRDLFLTQARYSSGWMPVHTVYVECDPNYSYTKITGVSRVPISEPIILYTVYNSITKRIHTPMNSDFRHVLHSRLLMYKYIGLHNTDSDVLHFPIKIVVQNETCKRSRP
jgi:hypothetical protein